MQILFAAGGSGGHTYPLIAIARSMQALQKETKCIFVSTTGSVEENLIPREGFPLELIASGKIKGQGIFGTLRTLFKMPLAFWQSGKILLRYRPQLVLSAGGYAGAPLIITAGILGFTCAIFEQNRRPGLANTIMAFFCRHIFLNFKATEEYFSQRKKLYTVGHPCREEIRAARWSMDESESRWEKNPFQVFVFGGSQGAVGINRLVSEALPYLQDLPIEILHQTGQANLATVEKSYAEVGFAKGKVAAYIYDMAAAYRDAQLVICRAGASSLAELAAAGKAALLIPLVSKDRHQEYNAQEMEAVGAAICALQPSLNGAKLAGLIKEFYSDRKKLAKIGAAMQALHQENASGRIAQQCINIINAKSTL